MTQTGPSSGIGAHCPEAIGGYCRAFLLRVVVRERGQAELPLSILFSSDEDRVCRTERGRFTSSTSPTKVIIGSPCACSRSACEPLNERKARRLRSPGYRSETQAPFSQFYFVGKDSNVMVSPVGHGLNLSSPMPTSFPYGRCMNGSCSQRTKTTA